MSQTPIGATAEWTTADVLRDHAQEWARIWKRTAIRPTEIPARLRTLAGEPIAMPLVRDHQIRIIGVQAIGADCLGLDAVGAALVTTGAPTGRAVPTPRLRLGERSTLERWSATRAGF